MQLAKRPARLLPSCALTLLAAGALSLPQRAGALTSSWINAGGGLWSTPGNWNNGVPTNAGDVAYITNTIAAASTITNDTPVTLGTLRIGPITARYNFSSGSALTMDSGGTGRAILQQTGSQQNYTPASLIMASDLEINNNGGAYFNLTGTIISGNRDIFINANGAGGTPYVGPNNTFAGNVTICSGKLMNTGGDPFGSLTNGVRTVTITNNAALRLNGNINPLGTNRVFVIGQGGGQFDMNQKIFTINGAGQLTGSGTLNILNSTGSGGTLTLGSSNGAFTGQTTLNNGTTLKLAANGTINSSPLVLLTNATAVLDVTAKAGGYFVPSNQILAGIGIVSGLVNAASADAVLHPGICAAAGTSSSPGILTLTGGLTVTNGGCYAWDLAQLKDSAFAPGTTTYSQLGVTGSVSLAGGTLSISFVNGIDTPATTNAFWKTNHTWTVISAAAPPSGTLKVIGGTYTNWAFTTRVTGNTLELVYEPYQAPQKGSLISLF